MTDWNPMDRRPLLKSLCVRGVDIKPGDRVRLRPREGGDVIDIALRGKRGTIAAIELDYEDRVHLAVTVDDDPGRDIGQQGEIAHRFFFRPDEVEPLVDGRAP